MERIESSTSTHLEPIEIREELCPLFRRIAEVTAVALACLIFTAALGGCIAFAAFPAGIIITSILTGVVGAVAGALLGLTIKHPSVVHEYQIQTLDQLDKATKKTRVRDEIQKVREIISPEQIAFHQAYDNHTLHNTISIITEEMKMREDLQAIWKRFLKSLQAVPVLYPDGNQIPLDFRLEKKRLKGTEVQAARVTQLNPLSPEYEADLDQIEALQRECFGDYFTMHKDKLRSAMQQPNNGCLIVRCENTGNIVGFLRYAPTKDGEVCIAGIGRSADAHHLHVGEELMKTFLAFKGKEDIHLHVRVSNAPAIRLYESFGFEIVNTIPSYCLYPTEDSYQMWRYVKKSTELVPT